MDSNTAEGNIPVEGSAAVVPPRPPALSQIPYQAPVVSQKRNFFYPFVIILIFAATLIFGLFFYSRYQEVKTQLTELKASPSPTPAASPEPEKWETLSNSAFTVELPASYKLDQDYLDHKTNMVFRWADREGSTPELSADAEIGLVLGNPKTASCSTNEACYGYFLKSFTVSGFNPITANIAGQEVKGFEYFNENPAAGDLATYRQLYPLSLNGKLFTIDLQSSAKTLDLAKSKAEEFTRIAESLSFGAIAKASPAVKSYVCPQGEWVDCMPGPDQPKPECSSEYLNWAKANCPGFQGAAL